MINDLINATIDTLYMTIVSTVIAYIVGLPLGIILILTGRDGLQPNRSINFILGILINVFRSIPFLILLISIQPFTRLVTGTTIGSTATIVPLIVAAAPFIARMVESSINEIDRGVIEAAQSMGATNFQIVYKVMLKEAAPSLMVGSVVTTITILGYSAMAGIVGGVGLGSIAINYGLYNFNGKAMWTAILFLVVLVQVLQEIGMLIAKKTDNRNNN